MNNSWWVGESELDSEQKQIIKLEADGNHLIIGPPGSGKTNLLLCRARFLALGTKPNIVVLVFTRALQAFIVSGAQQYRVPTARILTSRKWLGDLIFEAGVDLDIPVGFQEQRRFLIENVNLLIKKGAITQRFDAILLDEAQDYLPEEIDIFAALSANIFAVADSRQKIYKGKDSMGALVTMCGDPHRLRFHYRNGLEICKLADALVKNVTDYEPLTATSRYDESARPSSVNHVRCAGIADEASKILARLSVQLRAYPGEFIGVVAPRRDEMLAIWDELIKSPFAGQASLQQGNDLPVFDPARPIVVSTLHAVKGAEFRALHIASCEFIKRFPHQRNILYSAFTRAKTALSLYYSDDLPGFLEAALRVIEPPRRAPTVADVFKGGR